MAYIDTLVDARYLTNNRDLPRFANVGMAVGRGAPNVRNDVLLVQFMLQRLFREPFAHTPRLVPPDDEVRIDGRFGPNTRNAIVKFQLNIYSQFGSIRLDSRVDRARLGGISAISQTTYTILWMNYLYKLAWPVEFEDLLAGKIPGMPPELAAELNRYSALFHNVNPRANVIGRV